MAVTPRPRRKPKTLFKQIPVVVVRQLVASGAPAPRVRNLIIEKTSDKTEPRSMTGTRAFRGVR